MSIHGRSNWREQLRVRLETRAVERTIITVIIINAVILGLETVPSINDPYGSILYQLDRLCVVFFVFELALKFTALGPRRFFQDPWRVFDFIVVAIALVPATGAFSVLRSLRVIRVFRLVSASGRMRVVVSALLAAIPGLSSIAAILALFFYVTSVMSTKLFGATFPDWFGSIGASMYTLFQVMTLESWSMGIVRPVLEVFPYAWLFFIPFIMVATFTILNLFIAVIVEAMQSQAQGVRAEQLHDIESIANEKEQALHRDIEALREEIRDLQELIRTVRDDMSS